QAMRQGDVTRLGALFNASHASLRDDFEVTNDALNQIVDSALAQPGCLGARMTGAGFGGCAVALVAQEQAEAFTASLKETYRAASGYEASTYVCTPAQGAGRIFA
ncbi:MAG: hypothetical protein WHV44_06450, partial [Anaerolineales bacterium]